MNGEGVFQGMRRDGFGKAAPAPCLLTGSLKPGVLPKKIYGLLMKAAADALQRLARDPRYLGARIGRLPEFR